MLTATRAIDAEAHGTYVQIGQSDDDESLCRVAAESRLSALRGRWDEIEWQLHLLGRTFERNRGSHPWELDGA